jgi:spore germination cell wall hydrolase CwlJ-like protein
MKKMISIVASIIALTVMAPGHAEEIEVQQKQSFFSTVKTQAQERLDNLVDVIMSPIVDIAFTSKDVDCLAKNIYYEAGSEPEEGKVAVAMVTINRVRDGRFGKTICSVVDQRTTRVKSIEVTETKMVQVGLFGKPEAVKQKALVVQNVDVCQFSWRCMFVKKPKDTDQRWEASREVAERLLKGEYSLWQAKYTGALYFHATSIRPAWAKSKQYMNRIGGHHFYSDRNI